MRHGSQSVGRLVVTVKEDSPFEGGAGGCLLLAELGVVPSESGLRIWRCSADEDLQVFFTGVFHAMLAPGR
jgi:hypothetical protein